MSDILCVTDRRQCGEDFLLRLEKIAAARPAGLILREKDLSESEYKALAQEVMAICRTYGVPCYLHSFAGAAAELGAERLHLPLAALREMPGCEKKRFSVLGASCHSVAEALEAQALGCTYITAGHIFATDCKRGLPGRGTDFLQRVCASVSIPVLAIGGITPENIAAVRLAGAAGACVMGSLMRCDDVSLFLHAIGK